ncbi:MAG: glycosyltransferase [TACK group archaeon]|nr:glycosyltransferase [TACK group archaeon]
MGKPLVTIALAVKNASSIVRFALSSSFAQTYEPKEVIAADGMSVDGTLEELRRWPLRAILSDEGRGLGHARQLLLQEARGEYVLWVDADHVLPPDFLEKQVSFMEQHPRVGAVEPLLYPLDGGHVGFVEGLALLVLYARRAKSGKLRTSGTPATLFRRSAAMEAGGFDERFRVAGEDQALTREMARRGWEFAVNPQAWAYHISRSSWLQLWKEYRGWGSAAKELERIYPGYVTTWKVLPPATIVSGMLNAIRVARLTGSAYSLLVPLHTVYKRAAWAYGYFVGDRLTMPVP